MDALIAALASDDDAGLLAIFGVAHKDLVVTSYKAANSVTLARGRLAPTTDRREVEFRVQTRSGMLRDSRRRMRDFCATFRENDVEP